MSEPLPTPQGSRRGDEAESASSRRQLQRPTELPPEIAAKLVKRKRFPRARRWIFNGAVALSLVLFVGNYWLWILGVDGKQVWLSVFPPDPISFDCVSSAAHLSIYLSSLKGVQPIRSKRLIRWDIETKQRFFPPLPTGDTGLEGLWESEEPMIDSSQPFAWFETINISDPLGMEGFMRGICIPHWFLQLLFAILPLWWLWRWAERRAEKSAVSREGS